MTEKYAGSPQPQKLRPAILPSNPQLAALVSPPHTHFPMTNQELKALRLSLRMNQKDFANDFGVSLRTLQAYESGLTPIPEARIRAYLAAHPQTDTTAAPSPNQQTEEAEKLLPFDTFLPSTEHPADSTAAEIALLRERVARLQQLVDEKERTIQILLRQLPPL